MLASSRIYIGNLPATTDVAQLKARFGRYGTIIDIVPAATGFVYVQYMTAQEARAAVHSENQTEFYGSTIKVTIAKNYNVDTGSVTGGGGYYTEHNQRFPGSDGGNAWGENSSSWFGGGGPNQRFGQGLFDGNGERSGPGQRQGPRGPGRQDAAGSWEGYNQGYYGQQHLSQEQGYQHPPQNQGYSGQSQRTAVDQGYPSQNQQTAVGQGYPSLNQRAAQDQNYTGQNQRAAQDQSFTGQNQRTAQNPGYTGQSQRTAPDQGFTGKNQQTVQDQDYSNQRTSVPKDLPRTEPKAQQPPPPKKTEKPNDVEIICLMRSCQKYAERVEVKLKDMGLRVDVLFPNPDLPIGKVLGNIAMRGAIFGICIAPENDSHRSITLNVLQGDHQEHRNMPLDDALSFIGKNFSKFIEKPANTVVAEHPQFGLPGDIKTILGFLLDSRPMSIMEYDKLIKYLANKRESTLKAEYGTNIPAHLLVPPVGPMQEPLLKGKQEEIQTHVIEVLNKKGSVLMSKDSPGPSLNPALREAIASLVANGSGQLGSGAGNTDFSARQNSQL